MVGGEHSLKISALQLLRFGIDSVLKILNERITDSINQLMSNGGDCRTALATPGVLNTFNFLLSVNLGLLGFILVHLGHLSSLGFTWVHLGYLALPWLIWEPWETFDIMVLQSC